MLELQRQPSLAPPVEQSMDHAPHAGSMHVRGPKIYRIAGISPNLFLVFEKLDDGIDCRDAGRT